MKRKFLLALAMVSLMVCFFTLSISATDWFSEVEIIDNDGDGNSDIDVTKRVPNVVTEGDVKTEDARVKLSCDCEKGFHTFPAYYITAINKNIRDTLYDLDYTELNSLKAVYCGGTQSYTLDNVIALEFPAGYTNVISYIVKKASGIKYLSFAKLSTATTVTDAYSGNNWLEATGVEEIDIGPYLTKIPNFLCYNCDSLTSVIIPDQVTIIGTYAFSDCASLGSVYISKNSSLTTLGAQSFKNCKELGAFYLPSGVTSFGASGSGQSPIDGCSKLYFVSDPDNTEKQSVYYFPSTLNSIVGEAFKNCAGLNDVLVFHQGITNVDNGWAFCGSNAVSLVFLGNMEKVSTTGNAWNKNITIYYCNENDLSSDNVSMNTSAKKVFCHAEGNETHLIEKSLATEASCVYPKMVATYCFCGSIVGEPVTEGEALGHDYKGEGSVDLGIFYEDYFANGVHKHLCSRCDSIGTESVSPIFVWKGYSKSTFGETYSVVQGFAVNRTELNSYKAYSLSFDFGIMATGNAKGEAIQPQIGDEKVFTAIFDNTANDYYDVKVIGIAKDMVDKAIVFCIYVLDGGKMYYLDNEQTSESVVGVSHSSIVG